MYRVAIVCEGPSDRAIIEAILDHYLDEYESLAIQPPVSAVGGDAGPLGGGWKGVCLWCTQEVSGSSGIEPVLANADILVIHVDTDVAGEVEIMRMRPCPPPGDSANEIRALILTWLGLTQVPGQVVLCVPSMASETWVLVALYLSDPSVTHGANPRVNRESIECNLDIKALLRRFGRKLRPKLVVLQGGELKNQANGYRAQQAGITAAWTKVVDVCSQAVRFDAELRAVIRT